jgi:DNA-binding beta-propeller fold protein YncE
MLDGRSGAVLHASTVGGEFAWGVAVDARTNRAFVTNFGENRVYVTEICRQGPPMPRN